MKNLTPEQIITKIGVYALASLAVIGFFAAFLCMCNADFSVFNGTVIEAIFIFLILVLLLIIGFCFPASFLMNFSSIAASLKKKIY